MAVQAQYPSNLLLFNRNGQEGNDYSLQPQGGGFLDQSHVFFNNPIPGTGASNSNSNTRKRARDDEPAGPNTFSMQLQTPPPPPSHPHLSHLPNHHHHHHPNVVSTGLRLSFADQQHHHHQMQQQQQQSLVSQSSSPFLSLLSEDFTTQIKQQRDELDQFLQAQGEQLRRTLAEKRQKQYRELVGAAEEWVGVRVREKEAEAEKARRRNAELEARAAQLGVEAQVWQAKARAQEATAASLQAQLHQAIAAGNELVGPAEDAESGYVDPERGPSCRACRERVASVVVLPCRHFCLCTQCDQVAQACPLCLTVRNSSVRVFLS